MQEWVGSVVRLAIDIYLLCIVPVDTTDAQYTVDVGI